MTIIPNTSWYSDIDCKFHKIIAHILQTRTEKKLSVFESKLLSGHKNTSASVQSTVCVNQLTKNIFLFVLLKIFSL